MHILSKAKVALDLGNIYNAPAFEMDEKFVLSNTKNLTVFTWIMTSKLSYSEVRKAVFLLPLQQLAFGTVVALIFLMFSGAMSAFSAFYGASVGFVGSLVFALFVFVLREDASKNMTRIMFRAESLKILTISLMFYFAFAVLALPFMPVIVGFMATLIIYFVALLTKFR